MIHNKLGSTKKKNFLKIPPSPKKPQHPSCLCTYITYKQIELESPCCSNFEAPYKIEHNVQGENDQNP